MRQNSMLLARHTGRRTGRVHDGKVIVMRSNLRWCSDGFEIACWNGDLIRVAFIIDAHDREIIAWHAVVGSGISGSMVRDMMLEAVESRFGTLQSPEPLEWLTDNGSSYTAKETRDFATALNLIACFTPVQSPESNGISRASSKPSNATMLASIRCRMRSRRSARSPDGSRITTRTILTQGSECAPRGSSSGTNSIADCPVK